MDYDFECLLVALVSTIFFALAIFLGFFVNKLFVLFIIGFFISPMILGIKYSD